MEPRVSIFESDSNVTVQDAQHVHSMSSDSGSEKVV